MTYLRKGRNLSFLKGVFALVALLASCLLAGSSFSHAAGEVNQERHGEPEDGNKLYKRLRDRLEHDFDDGMRRVEDAEGIEISGDLPERVLRGTANSLFRHLRNIKAGGIIIGVASFAMGAALALLARKDKKLRKRAVGVGMFAVPGLLLVVVFGISWYVSMFK